MEGKEKGALDHLDTPIDDAQSHITLQNDFNQGEANEEQLAREIERLTEVLNRTNIDLKDKNSKILDLL